MKRDPFTHLPPVAATYLSITGGCNLRCRHCYVSSASPPSDVLTAAELECVLASVGVLAPRKFILSDDEPLQRKDFAELAPQIGDLRKRGVVTDIVTNGTLVNKANARMLAESFDLVSVSIDGFQEAHEWIRGKGTYAKTIRGLRLLREAGATLRVLTTVTSKNVGTLARFALHLSLTEGIRDLRFRSLWTLGRATVNPELFFFKH